MAAATQARKGSRVPRAALKPAKGKITSDGSGGKMFSSAISAPTPTAPMLSITSTTQPATPPSSPVAICAFRRVLRVGAPLPYPL